MIVYAVAAAQALFYLGATPLFVALRLRAGDGPRFGVGVGAFERRYALKKASQPRAPKERRGAKSPAKWVWRLARRARIEQLTLRGRLCLGDAAATALACGALTALAGGLGRAKQTRIDIAPDFDSAAPRVELQGTLRVRAGQLVVAAAKCGIDEIDRRIAQWTDRSKAS